MARKMAPQETRGGGSFSLSLGCRFIHGAGGLIWVDVGWLVGVVVGSGGEIVAGVVVGWQCGWRRRVMLVTGCHVWYHNTMLVPS